MIGLSEIVERKRQDVAARMASTPLSVSTIKPTKKRFGEALKRGGMRFILECKKASPSEGLIRADFNLEDIARAYRGFADAVSVLADEPYFQGSLNNITQMSQFIDAPILCKDFIVDPYQVYEARKYGADAVLLMLSVLDDETYQRCAAVAHSLAMDCLTEVHDEEELARALHLNAGIIGINNRDLRTMKVDLNTTHRLAAKIPQDKIIVCESGIKTYQDCVALAGTVDAFLVGSSLMHQKRLDLAVRRLVSGVVKICGLTQGEDAHRAYEAGASFGGVIFAQESPRCVSERQAESIHKAAPLLPLVGVFVNDDVDRIIAIAQKIHLAAIQLHGEETEAYIHQLRESLPKTCEIWKACRVKDAVPSVESISADKLLLDTASGTQKGGSGVTFDWSLLDNLRDKSRIILAGGLSPDNIVRASRLGVAALDVNSGVEYRPGIKDHSAIQLLFSRLRGFSS
ncbi:MAG: bifunctional indole-3-glycerol-phosphate synthase TrpC/phosphoribosylanthranilate isomerase TrpF [Burkholderiales bacterium]|nr:bifunctional indole-3-glycerol-phosphate synthase TrpC/phosphoribosylanthranilate isomerase TrpF [Burkholderiales bacterium]